MKSNQFSIMVSLLLTIILITPAFVTSSEKVEQEQPAENPNQTLMSTFVLWNEDYEGYTPGQPIGPGATAAVPPPGKPVKSLLLPPTTTGSTCCHLQLDGSYYARNDIGDTTVTDGYLGGWVYLVNPERFDILLFDSVAGATLAEIALQNDNNLYHWPGGIYQQIPGLTWSLNTWHELLVKYDEIAFTYTLWWDDEKYVIDSPMMPGGSNVDSLIWFGDVSSDVYLDNEFHFQRHPVDRIEVTPNPVTIEVGGNQQFTATAFDFYNNVLTGVGLNWTTDVGFVNSTGFFTAQTTPGTGIVTATNGSVSGSADVNVLIGDGDHITVLPNPVTMPPGGSQQFTATMYDIYNNIISGVWFTWTCTGGIVNSTGYYTASGIPGSVTAQNGTLSDTVIIDVLLNPVDHIEVIPNPATVVVGTQQLFEAIAYDEYNNTIPGVMIFWSTDVGVVNSTGLFTAMTTPGTGWVNASNGPIIGSAIVNVVAGPVDHIIVTPDTVTIETGEIQQFTAVAHDLFCNVIPTSIFVWLTDVGIIDAAGLFTAMSSPGTGTVTATNDSVSGSANVTVFNIFDIDISEAINSDDWILMSFPNKVSGDPLIIVQDVLDQGGGLVTWDIIQTYNTTQGEWLTTATFKPPSLNTFNFVNNHMAFWLHITNYGDGLLTIEGELAISGEQAVIPLKAGWNLVGYTFPNPDTMANTFGTLISVTSDSVIVYDPTDQYRIRTADISSEDHEPGHGYWVHVAFDENLYMWCP